PYADLFWRALSKRLVDVASSGSRHVLSRFERIFDRSDNTHRETIHLALMRGALLAGRLSEAQAELIKVERSAVTPDARKSAAAYRRAMDALLKEDVATAPPEKIDLTNLPSEDAAVIRLCESIATRLEAAQARIAAELNAADTDTSDPASPILDDARRVLASVDALLQRATRQ
ncbi:MAG: hypothetical protein N2444_01580, partial [Methylocystis sp.]|nr:hypothetical protein [Methylocystis sp.]